MSRESAPETASTITTLPDPDALRDRDDLDRREDSTEVPSDDFADVREDLEATDGWAVVGLVNDAGSILLMDDGEHGWTLPAITVREGDWADRAREVVEELTGRSLDLTSVERVRRLDYHEADGDGHVTVHHVVLRSERVTGDPIADEPTVGCDGQPDVGWFDALPDEVDGPVAADARLFL